MEKVWLKSYEIGVPAEIDTAELQNLAEIAEQAFGRFHNKTAFSCMGKSLSYGEVDQLSRNFSAYLLSVLGLQKGDRVALMMPNILQYPVALFGVLRSGLVVVNVNPLYTPRELKHQLKDSGAKAIVILENFAHTLEQIVKETSVEKIITTRLGDMLGFPKGHLVNFAVTHIKKMVPSFYFENSDDFQDALQIGEYENYDPYPIYTDDVAFLQYTGGTTGLSKGAILSHKNVSANVSQASLWVKNHISMGQETIITALPLYHIFSLTANCLTYMTFGTNNVLITNPRDIKAFVGVLKKTPFTAISAVNTLFNALLNHPNFHQVDFSQLKVCLGGGMAVQKAVADKWHKVTGKAICQAYGLTETSPAATINPVENKVFNGSIGLPISSTLVSIRDDDDVEVPMGEPGELCIKGPQVMQGYWQKPDEKPFSPSGWLKTGDVATMSQEGYVTIVDRKKDMILVSGFNVYPNEIEEVAVAHPKVLEACAVGAPDPKSGEIVKLFVVKNDATLSEKELKEFLCSQLTGYKQPKIIEFRDELPKTNVGKILRRALKG